MSSAIFLLFVSAFLLSLHFWAMTAFTDEADRAYEHTLFWYLMSTVTFFSTSLLESDLCRGPWSNNSYASMHARLGNNMFCQLSVANRAATCVFIIIC